jgi:hypothetical protein|tara:strand:- start:427 stop:597 length:171 start_codon:yes stop_codon:yes gene_type:complete
VEIPDLASFWGMNYLIPGLLDLVVLGAGMAWAEEKRPIIYPFDVTVRGPKGGRSEG